MTQPLPVTTLHVPDVGARGRRLQTSRRTHVMGILNVTPDSFSDGGSFLDPARAITHARDMVRDGADIIDIGGESARPGADPVSAQEEIDRIMPVVAAVCRELDVTVSIDTQKSVVAREALAAGAHMINDISALRTDPPMGEVIAEFHAGVILMHMQGTPTDMQRAPMYRDVIGEIIEALSNALDRARCAGISDEQIVLDPGIGFGKTVAHNVTILNHLDDLCALGRPVCIGTSRKSFIAALVGSVAPQERQAGTIAADVIALCRGARIIRVHDVANAVQAARLVDRIVAG